MATASIGLAERRERSIHTRDPTVIVADEAAVQDGPDVAVPVKCQVARDLAVSGVLQVLEARTAEFSRISEDIDFKDIVLVTEGRTTRPL